MKNTIITAIISAILVLFGQNYPHLFFLFLYFGIAYLLYHKMFFPIFDSVQKYEKEWDVSDCVVVVMFSIFWPIAAITIGLFDYSFFKELYNLPSWRLPFYWEEKQDRK